MNHVKNLLQIAGFSFLLFSALNAETFAQEAGKSEIESKIDLARHDFFYAGEAKVQDMYIMKDGKVAWEYKGP